MKELKMDLLDKQIYQSSSGRGVLFIMPYIDFLLSKQTLENRLCGYSLSGRTNSGMWSKTVYAMRI